MNAMSNLFPRWAYALYAAAVCVIGIWAGVWGLDFYNALSWTRVGYSFLLVGSIAACLVCCLLALVWAEEAL